MQYDCHIHAVLDGLDWKSALAAAPRADFIRDMVQTYKTLGYGYLRDGGDRWGACALARELAEPLGIRYRTPLAPISKKGYYGGFIGRQFETLAEYTTLVEEMKVQGADFIKIMISGLMDFDCFGRLCPDSLPEEEIKAMVSIAHGYGLAVMAHGNGAQAVRAAAEAGVDSIEHGAYLDEAAMTAMAEAGTVWVPTLSTIGNLRGKGRFREEAVQAIFQSAQENLRLFARMGGLIALGSDAGAWAVPHGAETEEGLLLEALGPDGDAILERGNHRIAEVF